MPTMPLLLSQRRSLLLLSLTVVWLSAAGLFAAEPLAVREIAVRHERGQTFVTWSDVAAGEQGAAYRYDLYRSGQPITAENLAQAEVAMRGLLHNSAKMFGYAYNAADRIDPSKPTMKFSAEGESLPESSGLAVVNVAKGGESYYAVVATDLSGDSVTQVVPGQSATTKPVVEQPAPLAPIKLGDGKERGRYARLTHPTGTPGLPLTLSLHASNGRGAPPSDHGDLYYYFANREMGYRDGLPGYFTVQERRYNEGNRLYVSPRDAIEHPHGKQAKETYWFGYFCTPQGAKESEPRAFPFTEARLVWLLDWTAEHYQVDRQRVSVTGGSMGAWGSLAFGMRHPELFASVYPNRPRTRQKGLPSLVDQRELPEERLMPDGKTDYYERMDTVRHVSEHHEDLPFLGWCCGRHDGFASWQEQIDLVKAMTAARHGFAFAWNNGDHSSGAKPMEQVVRYYPADKFARNQSYPAFSNSSIDDNLGNGDPADGDLEGGINLGFDWSDIVDEKGGWSIKLTNALCQKPMTVNVTPRRAQQFHPAAGERCLWSDNHGGKGEIVADEHGLVTIPKVRLLPEMTTELSITRAAR